jgi:hypothetical protein
VLSAHESEIQSIYQFIHRLDPTSNLYKVSDPDNIVEDFDSATTSFSVITFTNSCKSSGEVELKEDNSSEVISVSNVALTTSETRRETLISTKCYTNTKL